MITEQELNAIRQRVLEADSNGDPVLFDDVATLMKEDKVLARTVLIVSKAMIDYVNFRSAQGLIQPIPTSAA